MRRLIAALALVVLCACARQTWMPGVLRLGERDEPDSLNLMFGHSAATDEIDALLFTHLLRFNADGEMIPDLALAVPTTRNGGISADGRTITLHLRHGVTWSDGAPLTAADWLFTYHAVLNPRNNTKSDYGWDEIASAGAPDPYTLVIHLKKPDVAVLGILGMGGQAYPPLPAHLLAKLPDINDAPFNEHPISSGPFILQAWNHGNSLIFVPNPHYWRGPPKLKELIWQVIPDSNSLLAALQTHAIDVYPTVDVNAVAALGDIAGIRVVHRTIANWRHLGINMSKPGLSDLRVRQAIALGIDWKRLNDTVYHGYNRLAVSDIFPGSWAAPKLPPYAYDPQRARSLLAAAGYTQAHPLHLGVAATISAKSNEDAELVMQAELRPLGIALSIHNYPASLLFAQDGPLYKGTYDLEWSIDTNAPDPDNAGNWNSAFIPPNGANTSWLRDPLVDRLSAAAAATFDRTTRRRLYQQEEERLRELVPAVFFYWETGYWAIGDHVHGYEPAAYLADTWNAWEWSVK
ncbi:MAG TPA: peptide ABC transporter substrate-binding protein [Candidatus Acidoferrales bacterium]|nr:peptide ABC transporter substrate-binding protein [Candidatus Acidoferrales bacterium]